MTARLVPLGSGSQGNATLVELGATRVLVDAGIAARTLSRRLEEVGVEPSSLRGILLSHEHGDHAQGAERFSRKHGVPVFSTVETLEALDRSPVHFAEWRRLDPGTVVEIGPLRVDAFPVPHDAARPLGFVLEGAGVRAGVVTDLGHATTLVVQRLRGCQLLMVEANHDDAMLRDGPYPWQLKQRVGSRLGHLSNNAAARLLEQVVDDGCRGVILGHLSEKNNTPELARTTVRRALRRVGRGSVEVHVAERRSTSRGLTAARGLF
jgi:phosphoribosyl 1,2-cyclic phosphodiesterase